MAKCAGATGSVISIEPSIENFEVLSENVKLNDLSCVKLVNKAAGNEKKIIKLSRPKTINYGDTRIYNPGNSHEDANDIEMIDLDSLLDELSINKSKVRFIKIDCQGAEPFILEGMKQTIDSLTVGSCILLEIWPEAWLQQNIKLDYVFKHIKNKFDILNNDMKTPLLWNELEEICTDAYNKNNQNKLRGFDILLIKK
jgi:FkbM family methyltransferase